jgi:transposase
VQIADRWHLLRNLGDALRGVVDRHRAAVSLAADAVAALAPACEGPVQSRETRSDARRRERREPRRGHYAEIRRMSDEGMPPRQIAPVLGISQWTVERWRAAGGEPDHRRPTMPTLIDEFRSDLEQLWQQGCHNAAALWQEITQRGFSGSRNTVARWAAVRRGVAAPSANTAHNSRWRTPSRRQCAWLLSADPTTLEGQPSAFVQQLCQVAPALAMAADLARQFAAMIRGGDAGGLDTWLAAARASPLAAFAEGIARDLAAVRAAITEVWSTSPVEGHINRLKMIKRQMYGRAHYDLLRKRVLAAA